MHHLFYSVLMLMLLTSCSKFNKLQKSTDLTLKANAGIEYYKKKDYYKASVLLDEVVPLLKGKGEAEEAQYYQAYTYYADKQYIMSSYYFKDFTETYPRSIHAEECAFLHAKSLYKDSPRHDLDQTNTIEAVKSFQIFANRYPKSTYLEEANKCTDELNKKLEVKAFENAKLFYKISNYKSAVVAFSNFLEKYPDSENSEEIAFLKIDAQYYLARNSVEGPKKKSRFQEAIEFYHEFIDKYPSSKYKRSAENIYDQCNLNITRLG
jgi:outer membrane protein assembly factor BamD